MLNLMMNTAPADVLILPMTEDLSAAISFATALRKAGIRAQLHCEQKKFKQKLAYADKLAIPFAVFLGEDEVHAGTATVKDLTLAQDFSQEEVKRMEADGVYKQITLPVEEAVTYIRRRLDSAPSHHPIIDLGYFKEKYHLDRP